METVSASQFVRNFGKWQDRAMAAPVYIGHHGRTRLVMASLDLMQRLSHEARPAPSPPELCQPLLDQIGDVVVLLDADDRITALSPSAGRIMGDGPHIGLALAQVVPEEIRPLILRAVEQVRRSGVVEAFDLQAGPCGRRHFEASVHSFGDHILIVGRDRTIADRNREMAAVDDAVSETLGLVGRTGTLRINLRGFITQASRSFEQMVGLTSQTYRRVRLPALFDISSRVGVSDAMDRTIDLREPQMVDARLVAEDGEAIPVRIAFSAKALAVSPDVLIATVTALP